MKEILVLGHVINAANVESYTWSNVPSGINPADYDVVLVDFAIAEHELASQVLDGISVPDPLGFLNLLRANKILVFIGNGGSFTENLTQKTGGQRLYSATTVLPGCPRVVSQESKSISVVNDRFETYFACISETNFYFDLHHSELLWSQILGNTLGGYIGEFNIESNVIAQTRANHPVALSYSLNLYEAEPRNASFLDQRMSRYRTPRLLATLGKIIWLPPVSEENSSLAVNELLHEVFGVEIGEYFPDWVKDVETKTEQDLASQFEAVKLEISKLQDSLSEINDKIISESKWKSLLYLNGDELESVVQDAFEFIGFELSKPEKKGIDDGVLSVPGCGDHVVEIKGRKNQIKLSDVRQIVQWKQDKHLPGLMVVNANSDMDPVSRGPALAKNAEAHAVSNDIKILTTSVLFRMVVLTQSGTDILPAFQKSLQSESIYISMSLHSQH